MNNEVDGDEEEEEDVEVWDTLSNGFKRAQVVLDQNRELIQRVNENHMSRIPDNVARNVALINEINGNIFRVMEIYSVLSVDFADKFDQQRRSSRRTAKNVDTTTTTTTAGSYGGRRSSFGS
ncbi:PREDICTED: protein ELF4-LIKE 1-like [Camelina sativa]|uniref:Protein ELF4-LIKE 1-like n=1 Tax=Camelina sativa TaxID=90675 RepID=A0ABM0ZBE9_CAMSA|nr:PREDICTED: protein ELF4-LIKE 1-like [Camelina sativa]